MNNMILKDFLKQSMIAAIYVVLVYVLRFASFGLIQFRVAEVLMILIIFDKKSIIGVTLGCFVANLVGGAILIDIIFGSMATGIAGILMYVTRKNIFVSLIWPAVINGIIIGLILTYGYLAGPFYITAPSVFIGEAVILYALGLPIYLSLKDNQHFIEFFKS
ncbi:MAG: QueT transporter family protein [Acholeplasmataceae bacterium]|nr:QueT transporter family protein [Acholeplasmataceae bacterium]